MIRLCTSIVSILSFLFLFSYSASLRAQDKITISVGEWPPYISQDQRHNGIISHLISDIFTEMGIDASFQFLPWTRAYDETKKGRYEATAIWMEKAERKIDFFYSNPVLIEQFVFFYSKGLMFNWEGINDLKKFTLGGIYGYSYGSELDKIISEQTAEIETMNRPKQGFKMLLKGRIEVFPLEINVGKSILKKTFSDEERKKITYHDKAFLNNSSFLLFPKSLAGSKDLSEMFNQHLQRFKDTGQYNEYFEKLESGYYEVNPQDK